MRVHIHPSSNSTFPGAGISVASVSDPPHFREERPPVEVHMYAVAHMPREPIILDGSAEITTAGPPAAVSVMPTAVGSKTGKGSSKGAPHEQHQQPRGAEAPNR